MQLKTLSLSDVEQVRLWRNEQNYLLRTPFLLTAGQQAQFYSDVVCNRQANARFWGIWCEISEKTNLYTDESLKPYMIIESDVKNLKLIGMCGLENVQWENRLAEISLLLNPELSMEEYGSEALGLVLEQAFHFLNLENVFTEVYNCSSYIPFWLGMMKKYAADHVILPDRKFYNGDYHDSHYINFNKGAYIEYENIVA